MGKTINIIITISILLNILLIGSSLYLYNENNKLEDFSLFMISEYAAQLAAFNPDGYNSLNEDLSKILDERNLKLKID